MTYTYIRTNMTSMFVVARSQTTQRAQEREAAEMTNTYIRTNITNMFFGSPDLKLLKEHKNEKLLNVLTETDKYLRSLGSKVRNKDMLIILFRFVKCFKCVKCILICFSCLFKLWAKMLSFEQRCCRLNKYAFVHAIICMFLWANLSMQHALGARVSQAGF